MIGPVDLFRTTPLAPVFADLGLVEPPVGQHFIGVLAQQRRS